MLILFYDQVSVKDHCCQNKLGGGGEIYSSHVKCNFFACVFWPKFWLLWHYERILLSFINLYNEFLINRQIISKKEHPRTICHHHDAKRLHFMWDFVYLNFNWHYKVSCISDPVFDSFTVTQFFRRTDYFVSLQFQDHVTYNGRQ